MNMDNLNKGDIIIYQTEDGLTKIDVKFEGDTVWLTQEQMSELFQRDKSVITRHIQNIYKEGELMRESTSAKFAFVPDTRERSYEVTYYNLDVIISVGYRVKSIRGTQFRMYMRDYIRQLDTILTSGGRQLLEGSGTVSHSQALAKANGEYQKFVANTISPVEEAYLQSINDVAKLAKKIGRGKKQ